MKLGFTAFRAVIGATLFAHGAQKLFGWFGGYGLDATGQAFDSMGLKPGKRDGGASPARPRRAAARCSPPGCSPRSARRRSSA